MKKLIFPTIILLSINTKGFSQVVTESNDKALNGQLKRQAFIQWDDWQPSPNSWQGFFFWRWTWRKYHNGEDKRPYRIGGPVDLDLAQTYYFKDMEGAIKDSVEDIAKDEALNYANRSGGTLDYPYSIYYKPIFDKLKSQVQNKMDKLLITNPYVYNKVKEDRYYKEYQDEWMTYITERIETVHKSFGEKGDRILAYIDIHRQFENKNDFVINLINLYKKLAPLGETTLVTPVNPNQSTIETDKQIRLRIIQNMSF